MGSKQFEKNVPFKKRWVNSNTLSNFVSYYYQTKEITSLNPSSVLEIGMGNKLLSEHLEKGGYKVTTLDINSHFAPDVVGDVRNLPLDKDSYDLVCAFEVLEHIPFEDFETALKELKRVSRRYVVISLPIKKNVFHMYLKLLSKHLSITIPVPFILDFRCKKSKEHFWEINMGSSLATVKEKLSHYFHVVKDYRLDINTYHYMFVLEG